MRRTLWRVIWLHVSATVSEASTVSADVSGLNAT